MEILSGILYGLSIFLSYYLVSIEVHQYYSCKRLIKIILERKRNITIFLLIKIAMFSLFYINELLFFISEVLADFILLIFLRPLKYKKTRRNIILFTTSLIVNILFLFAFDYFNVIHIYYLFSVIFVFLSNILSIFITLPLEQIIRIHYINKAKNKLKKLPSLIIIGITGSFGKTTLKSYLYDFLSVKYLVLSSKENINTLMGVTKMINDNLTPNHQILVVELGIDEVNGFDKFKRLLSLDYAFITGIGPMHLATFKNEENILKAKLKIKNLLKEGGKLFVNADQEILKDKSKYSFSKEKLSNIKILSNLSLQFDYEGDRYISEAFSPFSLPYFDALLLIGKYLSYTKIELKRGIENIQKVKRRFFLHRIKDTIFIDDTYNNSSLGLLKSLQFIKLLGRKRAIIFTRLIELGKDKEKIYDSLLSSLNDIFVIFVEKSYLSDRIASPHIFVSSIQEGIDYALKEEFDIVMITSKGDDIYLH